MQSTMKVCIVAIFILSLSIDSHAGTPTQTDMSTVKSRIISQYKTFPIWKSKTQSIMDTLGSDGSWPDIDYSNGLNTPPAPHLNNIKSLSVAYVTDSGFKGDSRLLSKINLAYNYWISKDYQNKWWWNAIGLPQFHCYICLLMQPYFSSTQMQNCIKFLDRAITDDLTAANLVWTAQVGIVKAAIENDIGFLKTSADLVWSTSVFELGSADGIKVDGSFFQHDQQEYSGGYGSAFTTDTFQVIVWCNNTNYAMPIANLEALEAHVLDGQQWMILMPFMQWDIATKGREITRSYSSLEASGLRAWIENPGGSRYAEWELLIDRMNSASAPPKIGNKAYWISDYMVHARPGWMSSVKMYSTRTANSECVNFEGKLSMHMSDGANYLYQSGYEYKNVFALWDWKLIPGTTTDRKGTDPTCNYMHVMGKTSFVGVVSDNLYGAAAQDLLGPFGSVATAKKSWYFFDNEYVALGAGIVNAVNTTIEQKFLNGSVTVATGSTTSTVLGKGLHSLKNTAWWLHHDNVGYIFPNVPSDFSLMVDTRTKSGNWISINTNDLAVTGDTFLMYMPKKTAQTYAYIVVPSVKASTFASSALSTKNSIQIQSNTAQLQAVYHTGLKQLQATFWAAKQTASYPPNAITVTSVRPCMLIIRPSGLDSMKIIISDPTQLLAWTAISFNAQIRCSRCTYMSGVTTMNVTLPQGEYAGQTVIFWVGAPII